MSNYYFDNKCTQNIVNPINGNYIYNNYNTTLPDLQPGYDTELCPNVLYQIYNRSKIIDTQYKNNYCNDTTYSETVISTSSINNSTATMSICTKKYRREPSKTTRLHKSTTVNKCDIYKPINGSKQPWLCPYKDCIKRYGSLNALRNHYKIHTVDGVKCKYCSKTFPSKASCKEHTRVHTKEKPFRCDLCWKRFTQKHSLREHYIIHSGDRPFRCKYCRKRFHKQSTFDKHLKEHLNVD